MSYTGPDEALDGGLPGVDDQWATAAPSNNRVAQKRSDKIASRGRVRGFCWFNSAPSPRRPLVIGPMSTLMDISFLSLNSLVDKKTRCKSDTCPVEMLNTSVDLIRDCSLQSVFNASAEILSMPQGSSSVTGFLVIKLIAFFSRYYDSKFVVAQIKRPQHDRKITEDLMSCIFRHPA